VTYGESLAGDYGIVCAELTFTSLFHAYKRCPQVKFRASTCASE